MSKNLIIDGQLMQTNAWHRGMGKYTLKVLQQLSKSGPPGMKLVIFFNANLELDAERLAAIKFYCPTIEQVIYDLPVTADVSQNAKMYRTSLESCISNYYPSDDNYFLITSLFSFDFFAEFPHNCRKVLIFYDLTPLLFWRDLGGYFPPQLYMRRFTTILEADVILAISGTTRQDLMSIFGIGPTTITNINGGFTKIAESAQKPKSIKVPPRYILLPTGDLPHKNNEVAVGGYERFRGTSDEDVALLITSNFSEESKLALSKLSDGLVFTGNVSDEELEWLYEHSEAILFASKYEGLGMPILDAVANNKPIVTSRIAVFEEMSLNAFYYFEKDDDRALSQPLTAAIRKQSFATKLKAYPEIMRKYTWENTGDLVGQSISSLRPLELVDKQDKPRMAVISLHPGIPSQIGRQSEALYAALSQEYELDYYLDANGHHYLDIERPTFLDLLGCNVFDISHFGFASYRQYEKVLFILDDKAFPSRAAQLAAIMPGYLLVESKKDLEGCDEKKFIDIVFETHNVIFETKQTVYATGRMLLTELKRDNSDLLTAQLDAAIRKGGSSKSLIRRLLAIYDAQ